MVIHIHTDSLILGYYNNLMFPLISSISLKLHCAYLSNIIQLVKDYSKIISIEQSYGSSILPANALVEFVNTYLFNIIFSYIATL